MLLGARQFFERRGAALPYDAEVEYLRSTGTQYIDTGLKATEKTSVTTRVAWPDSLGYDNAAFEVDNGSTFSGGFGLQVTVGGSAIRIVRGNQYKDVRVPPQNTWPELDTFYDISVGPDGIEVNGTLTGITDTAAFTSTTNLPLFAWRRGSTVFFKNIKLGPTKIYDGATLVRDFIPVRKDGVGYMYDLANPTGGAAGDGFYGNAGTGAFTIGPDKS